MSLIIDSCSLINLVKAGLADQTRVDPCMRLRAGPVVRDEIWNSRRPDRSLEVPRNLIVDIDEDVDGQELSDFMNQHLIGPGEAESIILAQRLGLFLFCDDRKGRATARALLGAERVVGTLGLALHKTRELAGRGDLFSGYHQARVQGAFLPLHTRESFCEAANASRPWPCGPDCVVV